MTLCIEVFIKDIHYMDKSIGAPTHSLFLQVQG